MSKKVVYLEFDGWTDNNYKEYAKIIGDIETITKNLSNELKKIDIKIISDIPLVKLSERKPDNNHELKLYELHDWTAIDITNVHEKFIISDTYVILNIGINPYNHMVHSKLINSCNLLAKHTKQQIIDILAKVIDNFEPTIWEESEVSCENSVNESEGVNDVDSINDSEGVSDVDSQDLSDIDTEESEDVDNSDIDDIMDSIFNIENKLSNKPLESTINYESVVKVLTPQKPTNKTSGVSEKNKKVSPQQQLQQLPQQQPQQLPQPLPQQPPQQQPQQQPLKKIQDKNEPTLEYKITHKIFDKMPPINKLTVDILDNGNWRIDDIKDVLRKLGLLLKGNKSDLIDRLRNHLLKQ
jgi:hypothetical protein